jgi:hypothetical protein
VIVNEDGGADVHGRNQNHALSDPASPHLFGDLVGDVDNLLALFGLKP